MFTAEYNACVTTLQRWRDHRLVWDPNEYDNIVDTFIMRTQLWMPEIDIYYR
jgi:hypothetical protein